ncbi:MAG: 2-amino-4-hydroxy-6-hydroxymethyldihydropteridine diphosphokinase, partial [Prevotella sp.]|nr:2-amino-4-hydroxy-6-hydroxymethyldihydropteridine diphosphokinase [Prevotella sp.]
MTKHNVYLGLGANLGDKEQTIREAIKRIGEQIGYIISQSALHTTEPWGFCS